MSRSERIGFWDGYADSYSSFQQGDIPGRIERFGDLFKALLMHSRHDPLTIIIDEFQNLSYVNPAVFGDIQREWDLLKGDARVNLLVGGSVHSMMVRIFEDEREPLFNRATRKLEVRPFRISVLGSILRDHNPSHGHEDLLTLYMLTGGVPDYVASLMDAGAFTKESMLETALSPGSVFLREGNDLMTEEFGKDNKTYLSILQLIASGRRQRSEIESILKVSAGEYLQRLEREYGFVSRRVPMLTEDRRLGRWEVSDMYLRFYFRYIQPNDSEDDGPQGAALERAGQGPGGPPDPEDRRGGDVHLPGRVLEQEGGRGDRHRGPGFHRQEGGADRGQEEPRQAGHAGP